MTSGWNHRRAYIECDGCSCHEVVESDDNSIASLWSSAKSAGWTGKKFGEDWQHFCPSCSQESPFSGVRRVTVPAR